jgi:hypothetical protein
MVKRMTSSLAAIALCTSLTACNPGDAAATVDAIQKAAIAACGFLPAASTVLAIITAGGSSGASDIAEAICHAVTTPGARRGGHPTLIINGTVIGVRGRFVGRG